MREGEELIMDGVEEEGGAVRGGGGAGRERRRVELRQIEARLQDC